MPDIIAEVVNSERNSKGKLVTIRTEKLSPISSDLMVQERARARAIVDAGIADTVSAVFMNGLDIERLTSVESREIIDTSWPKKMKFEIQVKQ